LIASFGMPALLLLIVVTGMVVWIIRLARGTAAEQKPHAAPSNATSRPAMPAPGPRTRPPAEMTKDGVVKAIIAFRKTVASEDAEQIRAAIGPFKTIPLVPKELAQERQRAESMLAWLALRDPISLGEPLPVPVLMSDGDPCYFRRASVALEQRRQNDFGQLDIAAKGMFYNGSEKRLTLPWTNILTLELSDRSLIVHRESGGTPHSFEFHFAGDAKLAHLIALTAWKQHQAAPKHKPARPTKATAKPRAARLQPHGDAVRLSALPIGDASHYDLGSGAGSFPLGVVGESHRQAALHALDAGRLQRGEQVTFKAALAPEPTNPVDSNAIMVSIQDGPQVGYLQRDDAIRHQPVFAALAARHLRGVVRAKLVGGVAGKPSIGVVLDLNQPVDLLGILVSEGQPL
jgi:HIRAN domain